jgi:hypothetical protein
VIENKHVISIYVQTYHRKQRTYIHPTLKNALLLVPISRPSIKLALAAPKFREIPRVGTFPANRRSLISPFQSHEFCFTLKG